MKRVIKFLFWSIIFVLTVSLMFSTTTFAANEKSVPSEPQRIGKGYQLLGKGSNGNSETPGEWYVGETPQNVRPNSPVLLFVHGLNSKAQVWWEGNDMYQTAFQAGYETAFIQLHDAGGESANMWNNGMLLAEKLADISNFFNGKRITIVAHSKGGVDSQAALAHYGAWHYVDNVITLSSPHHGSQLADLAYSSWAGWLGDLIGMKGEGTESMQMGYMEYFRSQTDGHPLAYTNNYYTIGGTSWGPMFSANWFGGMYLSTYGQNDGVVTVNSSRLPLGHEVAVGEWDHTTVRTGTTFSAFESFLMGNQPSRHTRKLNVTKDRSGDLNVNRLVRGGELRTGHIAKTVIPIENRNQAVTVSLLTADELSSIDMIDPSGKVVSQKLNKSENNDGYFSGAIYYEFTIPKPMVGEWSLELQPTTNSAYLVTAHYGTTETVNVYKQEDSSGVTYNTNKLDTQKLKATYRINATNNKEASQTWTVSGEHVYSQKITLKKKTLYNVTIDIEGETREGYKFSRTIIDSVYVE